MRVIRLKCYRCGKENDVIDMRYTATNRMICKDCMEKAKRNDTSTLNKAASFNRGYQIKEEPVVSASEPKIEYICSECRYTFKRKMSARVFSCPYCNGQGTLEIKSNKTADRLIKESIGEDYD